MEMYREATDEDVWLIAVNHAVDRLQRVYDEESLDINATIEDVELMLAALKEYGYELVRVK